MKKLTAFILIFLMGCLALSFGLSGEQLNKVSSAVVLIMPYLNDRYGDEYIVASGSGTIIDKVNGLVLTNFHVVANPESYNTACEEAFIYMTLSMDAPPEPAFKARFLRGDANADVAILQIFEELPNSPVPIDDLPSLEWKQPESWKSVDDVNALDDVIIIGYPVYQMELDDITMSITTGKLSGFQPDDHLSDFQRAWIKTEALVSFGNSGGAALDGDGRLIGIPTQFVQDEFYGRMTHIRPVDVADKYVDEIVELIALNDGVFPYQGSGQDQRDSDRNNRNHRDRNRDQDFNIDDLYISPVIFANAQDRDNEPLNQDVRFGNADTTIIFAYFDYENMQDDLMVEYTWIYNNDVIIDDYFNWYSDSEGTFWIDLTYNNGGNLPPGNYSFTLYIEGYETAYNTFEVYSSSGGGAEGDTLVKGMVVDGNTGRGVAGVMVGVLAKDVTINDYLAAQNSEDLMIAYGMSDLNGRFDIEPPLLKGGSYSIVVAAEGYELLMVDGAIYIASDAPNRIRMDKIYLVSY